MITRDVHLELKIFGLMRSGERSEGLGKRQDTQRPLQEAVDSGLSAHSDTRARCRLVILTMETDDIEL